jgi:hypothetical protein
VLGLLQAAGGIVCNNEPPESVGLVRKRSAPDAYLPASDEVVDEHLARHQQRCRPRSVQAHECPCGTALIVECENCGQPLLVLARTLQLCDCATALIRAGLRHE